jgi:hypothetical protein
MVWKGFGFVHHSRTSYCSAVPNPNTTIRNLFIAVPRGHGERSGECRSVGVHAEGGGGDGGQRGHAHARGPPVGGAGQLRLAAHAEFRNAPGQLLTRVRISQAQAFGVPDPVMQAAAAAG